MSTTTASTKMTRAELLLLILACVGQFMVVLDVSIVNVALPAIRRDLGFSQTGLQWVVNAYALTFAGFLLLGGRLADVFGRRRLYISGLGLFAVASLVGGFAHSPTTLIAARAVQGLGGAVLAPATLTILTTTFSEGRARARALGVWSAVAGAGGAAGALAGGVLTDVASWRWILFVNVPIGAAAIIAALVILTETKGSAARHRLDIAGAITVTGGMSLLVDAIVNTDTSSWTSPHTLVLLGLGVALLAAFVVIEARVASAPLMPLGLFRSRSLTGANLVILFLGGSMFAMWFFLSLYLQNVLGYTPLQAGLAFVPQTLMIIVGAQVSSRLVTRIGPRPLLIIGPLLTAIGLVWLSRLTPTSSFTTAILGPGMVATLGIGLSFTPVTLAATTGVPREQAGLASGMVNTTRQVGGALGLAILATIASGHTATVLHGSHPTPALVATALTAGYARSFVVGAGIAAFGALAALIIPAHPRPPAARTNPAPQLVPSSGRS